MPEYKTYLSSAPSIASSTSLRPLILNRYPTPTPLPSWYHSRSKSSQGYDLLCKLFEWDPAKRLTAKESLAHPWFQEDGGVSARSVVLP